MSSTICPLCGVRKAKRACPALGRQICAVCCGTKRLVEISCPPGCSYLASSRTHPPAVVQRRQERDLRFLLPLIADFSEVQQVMLVMFQRIILEHSQAAIPPLVDAEILAAASAVASTLETARKGIIYQHQAASMPAQRLATRMETGLAELSTRAGSRAAALERDAVIVLRRIARGADEAQQALAGDEPPVFLKLLSRIAAADPQSTETSGSKSSEERPPNLIVPG